MAYCGIESRLYRSYGDVLEGFCYAVEELVQRSVEIVSESCFTRIPKLWVDKGYDPLIPL